MNEYLIDDNKNLIHFEIPQYIKTIELTNDANTVTVGTVGEGTAFWRVGTVAIAHPSENMNDGWRIHNVTGRNLWLFCIYANPRSSNTINGFIVPNMEYKIIYSGGIFGNEWWLLACQNV